MKSAHTILSHPTFCDDILPIIIGNNNKNSEWEHEKANYISSVQLAVTTNGYVLELDHIFKLDDPKYKVNIDQYMKDYNVDKKSTEEEVLKHIQSNTDIKEIDLHSYFRFTNAKDYLYWVMAVNSSQVANTTEDVEKSNNIRFYLHDDTVAKRKLLSKADAQVKAIEKLNKVRALDNGDDLLKDIAILKNIIPFDEIVTMSKEDVYLELFQFANAQSEVFLSIVDDKDLSIQATIKKYIDSNILSYNENSEILNTSSNTVIGKDLTATILFFKNPINKGEITALESKYKSLTR